MFHSSYKAVSPLDGRYYSLTEELAPFFSEQALMAARCWVEIKWFAFCNAKLDLGTLSPQQEKTVQALLVQDLYNDSTLMDTIKNHEGRTNHDVKSCELAVGDWLVDHLGIAKEDTSYVHLFCTSEDINSCAYAILFQHYLDQKLLPSLKKIESALDELSLSFADRAMLSRTHGQPASPTTFGKEMAVYAQRFKACSKRLAAMRLPGKWNGASGNYCVHTLFYPDLDWCALSEEFLNHSLGIACNLYSTQIETHDSLVRTLLEASQWNQTALDLCVDMWLYTSFQYLKLKNVAGEVGSSVMPHKINPIQFENAEGNFNLSTALLGGIAQTLLQSRLQRDLSDSTTLRSVGSALAYQWIGLQNLQKGLNRVDLNAEAMQVDLESHYEVLTEALQTALRLAKKPGAYELIKGKVRGMNMTQAEYQTLVRSLPLDPQWKDQLLALKPSEYLGKASALAKAGAKL